MCLVTILFYFIVFGNKRGIWERDEKIVGYGDFHEKEAGMRDQDPSPQIPLPDPDVKKHSDWLTSSEPKQKNISFVSIALRFGLTEFASARGEFLW